MKHARRLTNALPNGTLKVVWSSRHFVSALMADDVLDDLAPR